MGAEDAPLVSIIVPAHECAAMTEACLRSIAAHTALRYEVLLIDDASGPEAAAALAAQAQADPRLRLLRNETRRSYSENNNAAARLAAGRYLCLLNNDTLVTAGWLRALVAVAERRPDAGVIGNRHLFPDTGRLHHCGIGFDGDGHPVHLHPGSDPAAYAVGIERELQAVTFACVLIPRAVYEELGGLDEAYRNGYEDCDFCLRAREAGRPVLYTPASTIYHHGQATPGRKDHDSANCRLFLERWSGRLDRDLRRVSRRDRAVNRSETRRRRGQPPPGVHFALDAGQGSAFTWATAELIRALDARGERVSLDPAARLHAGIEGPLRGRLKAMMRRRPGRSVHVKWSHYWVGAMRRALSGDLNVEFFCSNYRVRPGEPLDLWSRHVQQSANRLLAIGAFNRAVLQDLGIGAERVEVLPLGYAPEIDAVCPEGRPAQRERRERHLLAVTNSHDLERYGTDLLVQALGQAFGPDDPVVVHIKDYGAGADPGRLEAWVAAQPRFPRVVWHREFVSKEALVRLYADMDGFVAPFRGEGFGMKILDAMAVGLPVFMPAFGGPTEFAPAGTFVALPHDEVPVGACYDSRHAYLPAGAWWCEARVDGMAGCLRAWLADATLAEEAAARGRDFVRRQYSWSAVADRFLEILQVWQGDRLVTVAPRRRLPEKSLSVVIPTRDRGEALATTLRAYAGQSIGPRKFEIVLVNDRGDRAGVDAAVAQAPGLDIRVVENTGPGGPAGARNVGLELCGGDIVLITGDDMVPDRGFLEAHLAMHRRHRAGGAAVLGRTLWHPELEATPFLDYLTGHGGQQFNYRGARPGGVVPFDRFYTSNVSLKRSFLVEEETLFSTRFPDAAYEDIELAYRLHGRGMVLRYAADAVGYHLHPTTPRSFVQRQRRVGRMLTVLSLVQPSYVPEEHTYLLRMLEFARCDAATRERLQALADAGGAEGEELLDLMVREFERGLELERGVRLERDLPLAVHDGGALADWLTQTAGPVWNSVNELALRLGMAEGWAADAEQARWARVLALRLALPCALSGGAAVFWPRVATARQDRLARVPGLGLLVGLAQRARCMPLLGACVRRAEASAAGRYLRARMVG